MQSAFLTSVVCADYFLLNICLLYAPSMDDPQ